jgi:hypothetical protein
VERGPAPRSRSSGRVWQTHARAARRVPSRHCRGNRGRRLPPPWQAAAATTQHAPGSATPNVIVICASVVRLRRSTCRVQRRLRPAAYDPNRKSRPQPPYSRMFCDPDPDKSVPCRLHQLVPLFALGVLAGCCIVGARPLPYTQLCLCPAKRINGSLKSLHGGEPKRYGRGIEAAKRPCQR